MKLQQCKHFNKYIISSNRVHQFCVFVQHLKPLSGVQKQADVNWENNWSIKHIEDHRF